MENTINYIFSFFKSDNVDFMSVEEYHKIKIEKDNYNEMQSNKVYNAIKPKLINCFNKQIISNQKFISCLITNKNYNKFATRINELFKQDLLLKGYNTILIQNRNSYDNNIFIDINNVT